ncbi:hypothetical protein [Streptomyces sp. NPDC056470]|uniref:hypothetical protein n=1 Tax=unclassified Streptomyces TaxID=2593676 RepID=UPI0036A07830
MHQNRDTDGALDVLVSLADPEDAGRIRERIGAAEPPGTRERQRWLTTRCIASTEPRTSTWLWMLEEDDPEINEIVVLLDCGLNGALELAVLEGEPFGPDEQRRVPVTKALSGRPRPEAVRRLPSGELLPALRAVTTMRQGRRAANAVARGDWPRVVEADTADPLPGYARWALALRPDCPTALRERFSDHPSYAHRMRTAGIVESPAAYVREWRSARTVLTTLDTGRWAFPTRVREAEDVLRPLVRGSLGANVEAWAVLAQLLPTFTGTVPELIVTAGAIA